MKLTHTLDVPAHIELAFEGGTPVSVNGITMPVPELSESLITIASDHGFAPLDAVRAVSDSLADVVVAHAREALATTAEPGTGVVRMKLHHGERTIVSVSPSSFAERS